MPITKMKKRRTTGVRDGCRRHDYPCSCAMGHLSRFVEPVVLLILKEKGHTHGYDLSSNLPAYVFTDAEIERAALYRTLRRLERYAYVKSGWKVAGNGPARRVYALTSKGEAHLREWATVLDKVATSMTRYVKRVAELNDPTRNR
ncbi:MAG: PadR family transcriptional regulator [Terriglobales bacterium]